MPPHYGPCNHFDRHGVTHGPHRSMAPPDNPPQSHMSARTLRRCLSSSYTAPRSSTWPLCCSARHSRGGCANEVATRHTSPHLPRFLGKIKRKISEKIDTFRQRRRERRDQKRKDSAADVMREGDPQNCHFGSSTGDKPREGARGQVWDQDREGEVVRRSGRVYDRAEVMGGLETVVTGEEAGGPRSRTLEERYEMSREGNGVEEVEGEQGVDDEAQGDEGGRQIEHEAEGEAKGGAHGSTWATLTATCQEETGKVGTCRVWEWLGNGETWLGVEDMVVKRRQGREGLAGTEEGELWLACDERREELEREQRGRSRKRVFGD